MAAQSGIGGHRIAHSPAATRGAPPFLAYEACRFVVCMPVTSVNKSLGSGLTMARGIWLLILERPPSSSIFALPSPSSDPPSMILSIRLDLLPFSQGACVSVSITSYPNLQITHTTSTSNLEPPQGAPRRPPLRQEKGHRGVPPALPGGRLVPCGFGARRALDT